MKSSQTALCTEPPDLLKRFVPTPLCASLQFENALVHVQTNDLSILNVLREYETRSASRHPQFVWKLVRDDVQLPLKPATIIHHDPVTFASMGPACLVAVDHEKRELFAFLGITVDASTLRFHVLPLLHELTQSASVRATEDLIPDHKISSMSTSNA